MKKLLITIMIFLISSLLFADSLELRVFWNPIYGFKKRDYDQLIKNFEKHKADFFKYSEYRALLGALYSTLNKSEIALKLLNSVPENEKTFLVDSMVTTNLIKLNKNNEAMKYFNKLRSYKKVDPNGHYSYLGALVNYKENNFSEVLKFLKYGILNSDFKLVPCSLYMHTLHKYYGVNNNIVDSCFKKLNKYKENREVKLFRIYYYLSKKEITLAENEINKLSKAGYSKEFVHVFKHYLDQIKNSAQSKVMKETPNIASYDLSSISAYPEDIDILTNKLLAKGFNEKLINTFKGFTLQWFKTDIALERFKTHNSFEFKIYEALTYLIKSDKISADNIFKTLKNYIPKNNYERYLKYTLIENLDKCQDYKLNNFDVSNFDHYELNHFCNCYFANHKDQEAMKKLKHRAKYLLSKSFNPDTARNFSALSLILGKDFELAEKFMLRAKDEMSLEDRNTIMYIYVLLAKGKINKALEEIDKYEFKIGTKPALRLLAVSLREKINNKSLNKMNEK